MRGAVSSLAFLAVAAGHRRRRAARARGGAGPARSRMGAHSAGGFEMGCVESDPDCLDMERPRHPVRFLVPFEMMASEVTVAQY